MNAVRSPMAERLARQVLPAAIFVASAGVRVGERDPFVDAVLAEDGLELGERTPKTLDELEDDYFDLIVTLAPEAHHAALELTRTLAVEVEYWPTADPTATQGTREQVHGGLPRRARPPEGANRRAFRPEIADRNAAAIKRCSQSARQSYRFRAIPDRRRKSSPNQR